MTRTPRAPRTIRLRFDDGTTAEATIEAGYADLDREVLLDERGSRVDQTYVDQVVADVHAYVDRHPEIARGPGRPSLSGAGRDSAHVSFRVPPELAEQLDAVSERQGVSRSALARRALAEYLAANRAG